jgi:hypothetical protein
MWEHLGFFQNSKNFQYGGRLMESNSTLDDQTTTPLLRVCTKIVMSTFTWSSMDVGNV